MSKRPSAKTPRGRREKSPLVLVAEDDEEMRKLLGQTLRKEGYRVIEVTNALELLDYAGPGTALSSSPSPDLIISDIRMPGLSGLSFLAGLQDAEWTTPVLLITAFGNPRIHEEARRLGAVTTLDKPFTMERLKDTVRDFFSRDPSSGA